VPVEPEPKLQVERLARREVQDIARDPAVAA
jgi:hypothetical protein